MNEEIEMELEALQSIFYEDYRTVDENTVGIELLEPGGDPESGRRVELKVTYTSDYPESLPTFGIRGVRGLTRAQVDPLHKLVTRKAETLLGQPMVYDLCTYIQEWIENGAQDPDATSGGGDTPVEMMQASKKHGTAVTKENFAEWKAGYEEDMEKERIKKKVSREKSGELKLTGRQLFDKAMGSVDWELFKDEELDDDLPEFEDEEDEEDEEE